MTSRRLCLPALLLTAGLWAGCSVATLGGGAPAASATGETYPVEQIRADFEQLYETLQGAHYDLYAHFPKARYDRYYDAYRNTLTHPMTRLEVAKRFQQFVALGRVAHARIDFPADLYTAFREAGGKALPLYVVVRGDRVYVEEGYEPLTPGDEIVAVDGEPVDAWLRTVTQHLSADTPLLAHTLLENQLPPLLWLEDGERESYAVTVRDASGDERTVTVATTTQDQITALRASREAPETVAWDEREARMLGDEIAYLRPGPFYNHLQGGQNLWDTTQFQRFVDNAFTRFGNAKARALLLDLRNNPGGTNSFSDPLLAWFAREPFRFASDFRVKSSPQALAGSEARLAEAPDSEVDLRFRELYGSHAAGEVFSYDLPMAQPREERRFDGQVYALVNRHSYSNAVSVAAIVQDYGFGRVLGEPTADLATTYGAMEQFRLEHTGLTVGFPKALIVRPNGDTRPAGVVPDEILEAPWGPGEAAAVLEAAVEIVRQDLSEEIR